MLPKPSHIENGVTGEDNSTIKILIRKKVKIGGGLYCNQLIYKIIAKGSLQIKTRVRSRETHEKAIGKLGSLVLGQVWDPKSDRISLKLEVEDGMSLFLKKFRM